MQPEQDRSFHVVDDTYMHLPWSDFFSGVLGGIVTSVVTVLVIAMLVTLDVIGVIHREKMVTVGLVVFILAYFVFRSVWYETHHIVNDKIIHYGVGVTFVVLMTILFFYPW